VYIIQIPNNVYNWQICKGLCQTIICRLCGDTHILHNFFLCSVLRFASEQFSLLHLLSLSRQQNGPFGAPASETKSACHAYQHCQPTNNRTNWMAENRIKGGLSEPQIESEEVLCQTQIKKKQPSNTSARKERQTTRPRCLVDCGTPLLNRADRSSSLWPGISTSRNPWQITVALWPSPAAHPAAHHTRAICLCSTLHHAVAPKSPHNAAHRPRQDQRITIRQPRNIYCMTLTLISIIYRVSQEKCARIWESVSYVKVHRYNPKHL
jgi:hypothetical protein